MASVSEYGQGIGKPAVGFWGFLLARSVVTHISIPKKRSGGTCYLPGEGQRIAKMKKG